MELKTGRSYGATNWTLLRSYIQGAPTELKTERSYGAKNRTLLRSYIQDVPMAFMKRLAIFSIPYPTTCDAHSPHLR